jgi:sugar fermentation stimulation protein A
MFFLVNRNDARVFAPAADIDRAYAEGLARARARGVEVLCYGCRVAVDEIRVEGPLAIQL